jgi:hypothetical protein
VTIEKRKGRTSNIFLRACSEWATAEDIAKLRKIIRSSKTQNKKSTINKIIKIIEEKNDN